MNQLLLFPNHPPAPARPPLLAADERDDVIASLARGAGVQVACRTAEVEPAAFFRTVDEDADFRLRLRHARQQLTENVASVVYQAAVKGIPAAQALWLRTFPPASYADPNLNISFEPTDDLASLPTDAIDLQLHAYRAVDFAADGPAA